MRLKNGHLGQLAPFMCPRLLLCLLATAALGACGGDTDPLQNPPEGEVAIESFEVSPAHLEEAGEVTLQWQTSGASSIELLQGTEPVEFGEVPPLSGTMIVQLDETETFTLRATSASGKSVTESRTVTVDEPVRAPQIALFEAPAAVQADEMGEARATLSWTGVKGASALVLQAPGQAAIELDPEAAEGSHEVHLIEDTTFELVATNEAGEASLTATVRVLSIPAIDHFDADRLLLGFGETSAVHWSTTGADRVQLWHDGLLLDGPSAPTGSQDVIFTSSSTLELRAFNELDTVTTATLEIQVGPPKISSFEFSSTSLWLGETTTISWETRGGSELEISIDGVGEILCEETEYEEVERSSCTWQPLSAGLYALTLSVTNPSGVFNDYAQVFAASGPLITHFDANPKILNAGDEVALSWTVHGDPAGNEPILDLVDDRGNTYSTDGAGTLITTLDEAGTYELQLEATTDHPGSLADHAAVTVLVHPLPVVNFEATPDHFDDSVFEEVVLSWTTQHAETVMLYRLVDGSPVQILEALGADREEGSYRFVPQVEERFQLVATNVFGGTTSREVDVTLAPLEVLIVEADPDAFTQGQQVKLSWVTRMADEVTIDIGTKGYILEETTAPYLDLQKLGGVRLPLTDACGAIDTLGCAQITFPDEFTFPFGDEEAQTGALVYTPGYLSFSTGTPPAAVPLNQTFPTTRSNATIALAPFWDSLGWDVARYPTGNVYTALLEEDGERIFVIQWRDIGYTDVNYRTASFNFEVVLREDGSFDFRYGIQSPESSGIPSQFLSGSSATIGFQLPDQSDSGVIAFDGQPATNGSRARRTFSYRPFPTLPLIGELSFSPFGRSALLPIKVTAKRGGSSHSKTVNLEVSRKPLLDLIPEEIDPVLFGEEFRLGWRSSNATALVVVDQEGATRCTAPNQVQINEGLCAITEELPGRYEYTVRAMGANDFAAERKVSVDVFGAFGVATFTADADSIEKGDDVLLSWRVFEASAIIIYANDVEIYIDPAGTPAGSFLATNVEEETEFKLMVLNDLGVSDEATLSVSLWEVTFGLQPSTTSVHPGDPITVTYDARNLATGAPIQVYGAMPMGEVSAPGDLYSDITTLPQVVDLKTSSVATAQSVKVLFPEGFVFPYMGETYTEVSANIDGGISLRSTATIPVGNAELPSTASGIINVQFAPFWDDIHPRNVGKMHSAMIDDDTFVIQWSKMALMRGSTAAEPHNLNFQVAFHRDGSFDYRYGVMAPHPTRLDPTWCHPADCTNEVAGAAATIGYQSADGIMGHSLLFGGTNPGPSNPSIFGGLTNRTFRYKAISGTGSFTFRPDKSETFTFCTDTAGGTICRDLRIEVEFGLRSALSKEEIGLGESISVSWESVGGKHVRVYEDDVQIYTSSESATVAQGSIPRHPTQNTFYVVELLAGNIKKRVTRLVEIHRASMTASTTASTGPGSPVTLSWTPNRIDPAINLHVAAPMVEIPNDDFSDYDLSYDEDAEVLIGAGAENANATLEFEDFIFPYFGTDHTTIRVATDGYLSWETGLSGEANQPIPNTVSPNHTKALAPFWEDLHTRLTGRVLSKRLDADRWVIQWSGVSLKYGSSNANQGELSFLVVLHRNGSFEFRYGHMRPPPLPGSSIDCYPASCERESNGSSATIGYQAPGGGAGHQIYFGGPNRHLSQMPIPGGLSFRAWKFTPQINAGPGSVQVSPVDSTRYKICAYDPASGEVHCAPTVGVDVPWGIDLFQVSPEAPMEGDAITLSWSVRGLDSLRILANGAELALQQAPNIQLMGTLPHTLNEATTYTIEATSMGRVRTMERVVAPRAFDLTVTGPTGTFFPGETVDVQWELSRHLPGDISMITPLNEIQIGEGGEGGFIDVSTMGATELSFGFSGLASFNLPFPFPYLGTLQNKVEVFVNGYLSFSGLGGGGNANNTMFPATSGTAARVHLAPFWDGLALQGGKIWRHAPDADTQIIQWSGVSLADSSTPSERYSLNFQVVLRRDGSFEYRYGTMAPPQTPFSHSACRPASCVNEANGSSATIGYQSVDAAFGSTLHLGAPTVGTELTPIFTVASDGFLPFPGGLSHRSFRYTPTSTGSARVVVGRTSDQEVCGFLGDFKACKSVRIEAVANPGDLMITEVMIDPIAGVPEQWLEVRNLTGRTIDLQGFSLRSTAGSHTIGAPLPVAPGGFITLASSVDVPFTPDYVYGGDVALDRLNDTLELLAGNTAINSMSWGVGWYVPRDQVLSLDPSFHLTGIQDTPNFSKWCNGGASGSPGSLGAGCLSTQYDIDPLSDRPFIDIALTGTRFYDAEANDKMGRLPTIGFQAKLFDHIHTRFWIGTNGWVSLADTLPTIKPETMPPATFPRAGLQLNDLKGPLIAPFWNKLSCGDNCQVFYERREIEGEDVLIIQWQDFHMGAATDAGSMTFQLQLWAGGDLVVSFGSLDIPHRVGSPAWGPYAGSDAWIGLESVDSNVFLTAHDRRKLGLDGRSILFRAK